MNREIANSIILEIAKAIDIPDLAYQTAEKRYQDLGEWLERADASCIMYTPHVFPQGSFRLGTVIRPINENEEYDLDLVCKLKDGITKATHSQESLKIIIGNEVESYRQYRQIEEEKEEKRRCWRLHYKDQLKFHLDILPCIPEEVPKKIYIKEMMIKSGSTELLAEAVSKLTVAITDKENRDYHVITNDWNISNPEGYALWFESKMKLAEEFLRKQVLIERAEKIDDLPTYKWKTPLQRVVQILKRHRDKMFFDALTEMKPISIIITTLAAEAYQGESEVVQALGNILNRMPELVSSQEPQVPNPVNPDEDFADKWSTPEGQRLELENNFWKWLKQAQVDFNLIESTDDMDFIAEQAEEKYGVILNSADLKKKIVKGAPSVIVKPEDHEISKSAPKPWKKNF
ncbi:MAG: nucleotidyltransferase domain-containing protein [Candidatus Helarchaeota archaeon]